MSTPPLRLFFAIPCCPQLARDIVDWRARNPVEGKPVAPENLHLTLAFLGSQPRGQVEALAALAASLTPTTFTLRLDRLARWKNGLLHLAPSKVPPALTDLERSLREQLLISGFTLETRHFKPHLTLARHCPRLPSTPPQPLIGQRPNLPSSPRKTPPKARATTPSDTGHCGLRPQPDVSPSNKKMADIYR